MTTDEFRRNRDNFCYRHADRQSFVLCQRCGRTVCIECQTPAPVGVVCPECMREQQKNRSAAQRKAERRWGGNAPVAVRSGKPVVTYAIIGITVALFLLGYLPAVGADIRSWLMFYTPMLYPEVTGVFQPWRLFTVSLVHSGIWHVGLNMLALFMIGRSLEPLLGRARYLTLYLISTLGGSVAVALLAPMTPVVGASGAIFGLFGALFVIGRKLGANMAGIAVVLAINLVIGFLPGFNISWQAHLGGLIAGALVGLVLVQTRTRARFGAQIALLCALALGLFALLLVPPAILF